MFNTFCYDALLYYVLLVAGAWLLTCIIVLVLICVYEPTFVVYLCLCLLTTVGWVVCCDVFYFIVVYGWFEFSLGLCVFFKLDVCLIVLGGLLLYSVTCYLVACLFCLFTLLCLRLLANCGGFGCWFVWGELELFWVNVLLWFS